MRFFIWEIAAAAKSLQSCPTLCDPMDGSPPGSPVPGILQARTLKWVAISFSSAWKWKVKVKSLSRVRLLETPWTAAHQAPPSMGFSRQEYWSGVPSPSLWEIATKLKIILKPDSVSYTLTPSHTLLWLFLLRMALTSKSSTPFYLSGTFFFILSSHLRPLPLPTLLTAVTPEPGPSVAPSPAQGMGSLWMSIMVDLLITS